MTCYCEERDAERQRADDLVTRYAEERAHHDADNVKWAAMWEAERQRADAAERRLAKRERARRERAEVAVSILTRECASAETERATIAAEARVRAAGLRVHLGWPEATGGASALIELAQWIEARK